MRVRKGGQQSTSTVSCVAHQLSLLYHTRTQRRVAVASLIVTSCHVHGGHSARCSMVHSSTANSTALHRSTSTCSYHGEPWDVDFYSSTAAIQQPLVYSSTRSTFYIGLHPTSLPTAARRHPGSTRKPRNYDSWTHATECARGGVGPGSSSDSWALMPLCGRAVTPGYSWPLASAGETGGWPPLIEKKFLKKNSFFYSYCGADDGHTNKPKLGLVTPCVVSPELWQYM